MNIRNDFYCIDNEERHMINYQGSEKDDCLNSQKFILVQGLGN